MTMKIGLEIHCYLRMEESGEKLFCRCKVDRDAEPNTTVCPVCTAQPGSKPMVPNREAVDRMLRVGLMLGCRINRELMFQRKHYSWPDLPSGYQRTMSGSYSVPVGEDGEFLGIRIREVHLEEDPAAWNPETGQVDYNRSGYPLAEIVTEPDFSSPDQVKEWLRELMVTLSYIRAVDRKGGIKSDVNISVEPDFQRVEIKNVNSFSAIVEAIEVESVRQKKLVEQGTRVKQETRAFDRGKKETAFMRSKENAIDYMFIPEPDLPIIGISDEWIDAVTKELPAKPVEMKDDLKKRFKLSEGDAEVLSRDIVLATLYQQVAGSADPRIALTFVRREIPRVAHYNKVELDELPIDHTHLIDIVSLLAEKKITDKIASDILEKLFEKPFDVKEFVKKHDLGAISDQGELEGACKDAIAANPKVVEDYKSGKKESVNFLVGQVMKATRGKSDAKTVKEMIAAIIDKG
ncbi:MAG: Asp-tRNA(Asn)/Glu-tRNA(Gln) amidotransferase subunit GatB [archaeon]